MKTFKKSLLALSAICAAACAVGAFAACSDSPDDEHAHVWNDGEVTSAATCDEEGTMTYTCADCGEKKTEPVAALAHEWGEWSVTKYPKSDDTGEVTAHCTRDGCSATHTADLPAAYSIAYSRTSNNASCTLEGTQHYKTTLEGKTVEFDMKTPPLGHSWTSWHVDEPTETEAGSAVRTCARADCDEEEHHVLPATNGDAYEVNTYDATCTADGQVVYAYTFENDDGAEETIYFTHDIPAHGHSYSQTLDTTDKESGDTVGTTCENCGAPGKSYTYYNNDILSYSSVVFDLNSYYFDIEGNVGYSFIFDMELNDNALYEFDFKYLNEDASALIPNVQILLPGATSATTVGNFSRACPYAVITSNFDGIASIYSTDTQTLKFTFDSFGYVGSTLKIKILVKGDINLFTMDVTAEKFVKYGINKISITDAGSFVDEYTFVPEESKVYSMTVPEGLVVLMNGEDFIIDGTWANFEATVGEPVTFAFSYGEKGVFDVAIGDEIVPPALTVDSEPIAFKLTSGKTYCLEVGEDVEEGVYTIEISGALLTAKVVGCGALYFMAGGNGSYSTVTSEGLYMQFAGGSGTSGDYEYNCTAVPWTVTLTLKAGDKIYFAPVSSGVPAGNEISNPVEVVLKAA